MFALNTEMYQQHDISDYIDDILQPHVNRIFREYVIPMLEGELMMEEEMGTVIYHLFPDGCSKTDKKKYVASIKEKFDSHTACVCDVVEYYILFKTFSALSKRYNDIAKMPEKKRKKNEEEFLKYWQIEGEQNRQTMVEYILSFKDLPDDEEHEFTEAVKQYHLTNRYIDILAEYETPHYFIYAFSMKKQVEWMKNMLNGASEGV